MKDKVLFFIIGLLIGAIVVASVFLIYKNVNKDTSQMPSGDQMMERPDGEAPPDKPDGNGGQPVADRNASHTGATEISSDTTENGKTYSSDTASQNSLLVTGGTSTLTDSTIIKSGDSDGDNSDFYGTNAAVLVKEGTLNINGGSIATNGSHTNAVFAYSNGTINISDTKIKTESNNSGAIMVTGGGTLTANNVTAETEGNSSAPIRSDRGGGTLIANGGTYTSHGIGSPAIYSTADITVNDATLVSTKSEGAVVEGKNSITLNNVNLTDTNTSLNGNSETYKNIFLYQSMSGDADEGTASFIANDSSITTNKGDTIFVTNTKATISLTNNKIINNDKTSGFLRIQAGKWGNSGSNGGEVSLNANNQVIEGDIFVDNISTLTMKLSSGSSYTGTINNENTAKSIDVILDSSSTIKLTGDSYVTSLKNEISDNSNIDFNGYKLYVNGVDISV
ncbi:MAG: hypothetical protein K6D97_05310 [Clostridia bacterium]|nr:hypothetical protein [Clostridia bacterium]